MLAFLGRTNLIKTDYLLSSLTNRLNFSVSQKPTKLKRGIKSNGVDIGSLWFLASASPY